MSDIIVEYRKMSYDEKIRWEAFYREKRLHDEATALGGARREGRAEGEAIGIAKGRAEGRAELKAEYLQLMRQKGFSEEQIRSLSEGLNND